MAKKLSFRKKFFSLKNIFPLCLILFAFLPVSSFAQNEVSGIVKDNSGGPLENVSVMVQGTTRGTTTDVTGKFSISASSNAKLIFSFTGYE
ncbi:MAG: carboxypeptidase-like regulatory domain-containing protein, partial [Ginsengibacter sp.]